MSRVACVILCLFGPLTASAAGPHLATGIKVGEVTQTRAIVWARLTREAERVWDGVREPRKREPRVAEYTPSKTRIEDRDGACPGTSGWLRVRYGDEHCIQPLPLSTKWVEVGPKTDFAGQVALTDLEPNMGYAIRVEAKAERDGPITATMNAAFRTPARADTWQDVNFTVITGQSYWDLDDKRGYHIYPAMQKLKPEFIVPTGDTVYMDSESPRARTVPLARHHWNRMYSLPRHVEFHRHVPGYWEVDDHDSWVNDCWPTMTAKWISPLTFEEGFAVYREQVPIGEKTYRTVRWGRGLQVWMVEGRLYRSPNNVPDGPDKTIWGREQLAWLQKSIAGSDADFKVLISPTPIVGPDRNGKGDNHSNKAFAHEGRLFRNWTKTAGLKNFYVCNGDRHWQYVSIDPESGLREFSCGPASDKHAGGNPKQDEAIQPWLRVKGGFLSVAVTKDDGQPTIAFRHHDVQGDVVHEVTDSVK